MHAGMQRWIWNLQLPTDSTFQIINKALMESWWILTVSNLLIEERDFKLQIKLLAHTSFRFHLGNFTKWCSSTFYHVIYIVNHVTKRLGRRLRAPRDLPRRFGLWFTVKITWQNVELHHLVKIPRWNRKLVCAKSFIRSLKPPLCYLQTSYWRKWTIERNIDRNVS